QPRVSVIIDPAVAKWRHQGRDGAFEAIEVGIHASFSCQPAVRSGAEPRYAVRTESQADILGFHVEIEAVVAAVAADATRLHAPEGCRQMPIVLGIHPYHAGIEMVSHPQRPAAIAGPD